MINSELREYMSGVISHYIKDYPYYFMTTNTSTGNYWSQYGATVYMSKTEPTVHSQYSMTSDEWLVLTVYSSNASRDDHTPRVVTRITSGIVQCNEWEYVYSNVESSFAYSSVDIHPDTLHQTQTIESAFSVIQCACLIVVVISIWLKR